VRGEPDVGQPLIEQIRRMGWQAWQDISEVRERIDIMALARGRGGGRFGGLAIPVARGDSRGLAVATGQRWPQVEGPVLQPLAEAEAPDGELAAFGSFAA
jgi:hypothetical protein